MDAWNQVLPHVAAALKAGSKFLITSRTHIWMAAKNDLKASALPALSKSNVTIQVEKLTTDEKAQIAYNHLKFGDQDKSFRTEIKGFLPAVVGGEHFLPESARRLGNRLLSGQLKKTQAGVSEFFEKPSEFLLETVRSLAPQSLAALALLFVSSGRVSSPIADGPEAQLAMEAFGVTLASLRSAVLELNDTLSLHAQDHTGVYWQFKHPTVGESIGRYVAENPELVELYLRGAKAESLMAEIVCPGVTLTGALVVVPPIFYDLLVQRLSARPDSALRSFLTTRANTEFAVQLLAMRSDLLELDIHLPRNYRIAIDSKADFLAKMNKFGLLPEKTRKLFAEELIKSVWERADASVLQYEYLREVLTPPEQSLLLSKVESQVLNRLDDHVDRVSETWDTDYSPANHFDDLEEAVRDFIREVAPERDKELLDGFKSRTAYAVEEMTKRYRGAKEEDAPVSKNVRSNSNVASIFRDVDD
ncbi:hypothetical protein B0G80_2424 [Paraburkholderia sp. BL6669N2]|nr:hypothetical protein [Paraburkholderia sp. BL6669N2]REG59656.1 hypothetical protein B0G80_2424 [Paraburkholderia sp. BL6669N2]